MGELHHEASRRERTIEGPVRVKVSLPATCEIHVDLRVPDNVDLGGRNAETAIEDFAKRGGWVRSDRAERRGPQTKCVHIIYVVTGGLQIARRGVKGLVSAMASMEVGKGQEIGLDAYVVPLLY